MWKSVPNAAVATWPELAPELLLWAQSRRLTKIVTGHATGEEQSVIPNPGAKIGNANKPLALEGHEDLAPHPLKDKCDEVSSLESSSQEKEASDHEPEPASESTDLSWDLEDQLTEWCAPVGSSKLHKLKDGQIPGCAGKDTVPANHYGLGAAEALRAWPDRLWCRTCARRLFIEAGNRADAKAMRAAGRPGPSGVVKRRAA